MLYIKIFTSVLILLISQNSFANIFEKDLKKVSKLNFFN